VPPPWPGGLAAIAWGWHREDTFPLHGLDLAEPAVFAITSPGNHSVEGLASWLKWHLALLPFDGFVTKPQFPPVSNPLSFHSVALTSVVKAE
jgi:hypothetical protein